MKPPMKPPYTRLTDPEPGTSIEVSGTYGFTDPGARYTTEYFVTYAPTHWLFFNGGKDDEKWRVQVMILITDDTLEYHTRKSIDLACPDPVVKQYRENGRFGPLFDRWATEETVHLYGETNRYQVVPIVEDDQTTELLPIREVAYYHVCGHPR